MNNTDTNPKAGLAERIIEALNIGLGHTQWAASRAHFEGGQKQYGREADTIRAVLTEVEASRPAVPAQDECGIDRWCMKPECRKCHPQASPAPIAGQAVPEFDRDTDGELLIDWSPSPGRMFTLSLRDDGRLSYALTWDGENSHGTAQMPAAQPVQDTSAAPSDEPTYEMIVAGVRELATSENPAESWEGRARAMYIAMRLAAPSPQAPSEAAGQQPVAWRPRVTPYNVGAFCRSEDECIAQGINFAAYEKGVSDAAEAFGRNAASPTAAPAPTAIERWTNRKALGWYIADCKICGESLGALHEPSEQVEPRTVRMPMSEEQILDLAEKHMTRRECSPGGHCHPVDAVALVRAIEAHHGISAGCAKGD